MGPQRLNSSPPGRAPTLWYFLPPQHSRYQDTTPGFTTHEASHERKQKRTLNTPVSPWELADTYSGLQMSVILMNTPKIKFLGIRFLRTALKRQHSLAGVVLQNRKEIDLLIPEQGGTWAILNETCCFWVNLPPAKLKKVSQSSRTIFRSYWISKNELESSQGGYNLSLGDPSPGYGEFWVG